MRRTLMSVVLAAALAGGCRVLPSAPAGPAPATAGQTQPGVLTPETKVLSLLHEINQRQVRLGQVAESKAHDPQVRRYAEQLTRDHQLSDRRVVELARRKGIELVELKPETDDERWQAAEHQEVWRQLEICERHQFDLAFLPVARRWHDRDTKQLMARQLQLTDQDVKALVKKLLPILGQHETLADHVNWSVRAQPSARRE